MHPIEHLRFVARARGLDTSTLVEEAVTALVHLGRDRNDVLLACRRLLERHPEEGPLWWACSHVLAAADTRAAANEVVEKLRRNGTAGMLGDVLSDGATVVTVGRPETIGDALVRLGDVEVLAVDSGHEASGFLQRLERNDVRCEPVPTESIVAAVAESSAVLVEAVAVAPGRLLVETGSVVVASVAAVVGTEVLLVAPSSRRLHRPYVDEMVVRLLDRAPSGRRWAMTVDELPPHLVGRYVTATEASDDADLALRPDCPFTPELLRASPF